MFEIELKQAIRSHLSVYPLYRAGAFFDLSIVRDSPSDL